MRASQARKMARDAHAAAKLECCGIRFSGKTALRLHQRDHKRSNKNKVYDE